MNKLVCESLQEYINEAENEKLQVQQKWLDNLLRRTIKPLKVIVPPANVNDLRKILEEQHKTAGPASKDNMVENEYIKPAIEGKDIGIIGHEAIHALQGKTTDLLKNLPPLDLGDPEVDWDNFDNDIERKKFYYSRPPEIMAFAWTYIINKDDTIKKEYARLDKKIYAIFVNYVNQYKNHNVVKNWINNFKKSLKVSVTKIDGYNLPFVIIPQILLMTF